jgi:hypothetical protein
MKEVCIYASQVAAIIGYNKHKKVSDILELIWERHSPDTYYDALRRNNVQTEQEIIMDIVERDASVKALLLHSSMATPTTSSDVATTYNALTTHLHQQSLNDDEKKLLDSAVKKNLYTVYGNTYENRVVEHLKHSLNMNIVADDTNYKQDMQPIQGVPWSISGKIDAINDRKTIVIEIKNRINKLFWKLPKYEHVQVQVYLQLVNVENGLLVESYSIRENENNETKNQGEEDELKSMKLNIVPIKRDQDFWNTIIIPHVTHFVSFYINLLNNRQLQDKYMRTKRKKAFITKQMEALQVRDRVKSERKL